MPSASQRQLGHYRIFVKEERKLGTGRSRGCTLMTSMGSRNFSSLVLSNVVMLGATGCSRSPQNPNPSVRSPTTENATASTDLFALYDPGSLVEVRRFSNLPNDLKSLIRAGVLAAAEPDNDDFRHFLAGGRVRRAR
jgi:hypothetical protein